METPLTHFMICRNDTLLLIIYEQICQKLYGVASKSLRVVLSSQTVTLPTSSDTFNPQTHRYVAGMFQ